MTGGAADRRRKPRWDVALRAWLEDSFENWAHVSARRPWPIIASMLALALLLGSQLPRLEIDTSTDSFLRADDPARVVYDAFREQFGSDQLIMIAVRPPSLFAPPFLETLARLHRAIEEEVPHVNEVTSLINVRETRGEANELIVRELLEGWPVGAAELSEIRERALANPLYRNHVISADGHATTLTVELEPYSSRPEEGDELSGFDVSARAELTPLTGEEEAEAFASLRAIVARFQAPELEFHLAGGPVIAARLASEMARNIVVFLSLSLVAVAVLLFALFRRASAVALPLLVVLLSMASTFGVMGLVGVPVGLPTQILPSFLLAVGVGGTVHLLVIFFQAFDAGASREEALAHALHHSGLAIVMTALTTAGGLVSFAAAKIQPVADLGIFAPLGIGLGLTYCMVLLPPLLTTVPLKRRPPVDARRPDWIGRALLWTGDRCVGRPKTVLVCMSAILLFALVGTTRLTFNYDPVGWFPDGDPLRTATEVVNREFGGLISLEVLLETGRENGLHEPAVLNRLDAFHTRSAHLTGDGGISVGKTFSIVDISKEIHQALNENRSGFYTIPDNRQLVAQELLLFENSGADDLEQLVDPPFRRARMTLKLPYVPPVFFHSFIPRVTALARETLGEGLEITTTGYVSLMARSLNAISESLRRSYLIALAIITPLMFLLLGTFRTGLAAMVPNLAPIILTLGLMGWAGIPLDLFTLMIGSISIGLAVDDTIHFMHIFRKYFEELGDTREAVRETLRTTGHALLVTSIVLSLAFFIYAFASLGNLAKFGLLTGLTVVFAFVADVSLSPALMALSTRGDRLAAERAGRRRP